MRIFANIGPLDPDYPKGSGGNRRRTQTNLTDKQPQTNQKTQKNFKKSSQLEFG